MKFFVNTIFPQIGCLIIDDNGAVIRIRGLEVNSIAQAATPPSALDFY